MTRRRLVLVAAVLGTALVGGVLLVRGLSTDGDRDAYCERLASIPDLGQVLTSLDASDPGGVESQIQTALEDYAALESDAPSSVADDVAALRRGVELVLEAVRDNPGDLPAARQAIQARQVELEGLTGSGARVADDAQAECSLTLE